MGDIPESRFYDGSNYQIDDSIGYVMRQIVNLSSTIVDERMADHGLTDAQWKPLLMIQQGHCSTAAEVARMACCDTGAVTRLVDRVEAKGLVRRTRSTEDRRVVKLELTEEGQQAAEVVPHVLAGVLNSMLAGFSDEEVRALQSLLKRLLENTRRLRVADADSQD